MIKKPQRPRDSNQLAKFITDVATGEVVRPEDKPSGKSEAAMRYGRQGGLKGGKMRADKLSPEEQSTIAKTAADKRWGK